MAGQYRKYVGQMFLFLLFLIYNFKNQLLTSEWFTCLWNNCTFQSNCEVKSTTHVNFHAYHTRLKCVGLAVLNLCEIPVCTFLLEKSAH